MKIASTLVAVTVVISIFAIGARADTVTETDPQGDNAGRNSAGQDVVGRLDIAEITHEHLPRGTQEELLVHNVETYDEWSSGLLPGGTSEVTLRLSLSHSAAEASVSIGVNADGSLFGEANVCLQGSADCRSAGFARVWRPDSRSVAIALTRAQIWPGHSQRLTEYRWSAYSSDDACTNADSDVIAYCFDQAPDAEGLRHVVQGPGSFDCRDGVDNDDDGGIDFSGDAGCSSEDDYFEGLTEDDCPGPCPPPELTIVKRTEFPHLRGRLSSNIDGCEPSRNVRLFRVRAGADRWVSQIWTDARGRWGLEHPRRRGRYYVVAPGETEFHFEETVWCSRLRSTTIRIGEGRHPAF